MVLRTQALGADVPYLGIVNAERVHVEAVHEAGEALAEPGQALMHQLEMHHIGLEVGHGVRQFGEGGLEGIEGERGLAARAPTGGIAEGRARGWSKWGCWARSHSP